MTLSADDRAWLADQGRCIQCAKPNDRHPAQATCTVCADKSVRRRLIREGKNPDLCTVCKTRPRALGKSRCNECRATPTAKARRIDGMCLDCGKVPVSGGRIRCKACSEKLQAKRNALAEQREAHRMAAKNQPALPKYNEDGLRLCHDCKAVYTPDFRCPDCNAAYRKRHGVSGYEEVF